jgi:phosphoribosylamine-glycine ligase
MLKRAGVQVVALLLMMVMSSVDSLAQKRISFRRGASSATVRGKIAANGYTEYVINGRAGQLMSIDVKSGNGAVVVNAGTASGKNFSLEMSGGDHLLSIVNTSRSATNYTLTVTIE